MLTLKYKNYNDNYLQFMLILLFYFNKISLKLEDIYKYELYFPLKTTPLSLSIFFLVFYPIISNANFEKNLKIIIRLLTPTLNLKSYKKILFICLIFIL